MSNSKNDKAWQLIFDKHKILDRILKDGFSEITATKINEFREARLMTKFDHKSQLPKLFLDNSLSILPTSRGGYVIGEFDTFCDFNKSEVPITKVEFPHTLESLDFRNITSEATAINCSYVSNILSDFTDDENLLPTVSGRMSSSTFSFGINSNKGLFNIKVENSQVEIDGGYEGNNSLNLIEAKNYISEDFLIRQLYYPFKLWSEKVGKKVRPIFLTYTNGIFHLREYSFKNVEHYNSLVLLKEKKYSIQEGTINNELIQKLIDSTKSIKEPEIPFPQADSFERVINLCELLKERGYLTREEITQNYDFDSRQTNYYSDAGRYLGLIQKNNSIYTLTKLGELIFNKPIFERKIDFIKLILSHSAFKKTLKSYFNNGEMPNTEEIIEIMKSSKLYNIGEHSTYKRRSSTIKSWINWIIDQNEE
jgi:hypothetical protein